MKILFGCNKSGREAIEFSKLGHVCWTCDILPAEHNGNHIQDDVLKHLNDGWDMAIFNPDCTYLANSGVRWLFERPERWELMRQGAEFFNKCLDAPIPIIAVENPIQHKYARELIRKPDQIIQPWMFGDNESKAICLWLKGLTKLIPSITIKPDNVKQSVWYESPSLERKANRSRSFIGISRAMAKQWGCNE